MVLHVCRSNLRYTIMKMKTISRETAINHSNEYLFYMKLKLIEVYIDPSKEKRSSDFNIAKLEELLPEWNFIHIDLVDRDDLNRRLENKDIIRISLDSAIRRQEEYIQSGYRDGIFSATKNYHCPNILTILFCKERYGKYYMVHHDGDPRPLEIFDESVWYKSDRIGEEDYLSLLKDKSLNSSREVTYDQALEIQDICSNEEMALDECDYTKLGSERCSLTMFKLLFSKEFWIGDFRLHMSIRRKPK